ncbi:LON peptidase substrate-binding domain-containing protein [Thiohalorhabdus sp.]|uniref:LON peptidase substrate-binding domain-containing protein n=1 Tax=Thiohalorhabdus sp. TaxID=3094134 RepID=UPI002FC3CA81
MGNLSRYRSLGDLPSVAPVFPLTGALLLPGTHLPLNIFEPRYLAMIDAALAGDRLIGMIQPAHPGAETETALPELSRVGCLGRLTSFSETGDGRYLISLTGILRFAVAAEVEAETPFRQVRMDFSTYAEDLEPAEAVALDRDRFFQALTPYLEASELEVSWEDLGRARTESLVNTLAVALPLGAREKQGLLLAETLNQRAQLLLTLLEMARGSDSDEPDGGSLQ